MDFKVVIFMTQTIQSRLVRLWRIAGVLIVALLGYQALSVANIDSGDNIDAWGCDSCHAAGSATNERNAPLLVGSEEALCTVCHKDALIASHPSGIVPSMDTPKAFSLSMRGALTCSSCHDVHGEQHGSLTVAADKKTYCLSCHEPVFFANMADNGSAILDQGHLSLTGNDENIALDRFSEDCLQCHENQGPEATPQVVMGINGVVQHVGGRVNHPVGIDYEAAAEIALSSYVPIAALADSMVLPEGRVSCLSCHVGYSKTHGSIVETPNNRELCFECHDL